MLNSPVTSMMMLYCLMSYPGNYCLSSQWRGPYLVVFSSCFFPLFSVHGQLISTARTLLSWSINLASTLFCLTCSLTAKNGISQYVWASGYRSSRSRTGAVSYTHMRLLAKRSEATNNSRLTYTMNNQSYICLTCSGLGTTNSFTAGRKLSHITTRVTHKMGLGTTKEYHGGTVSES